ncbi:non-symbiotic hemoglobin 1-like [Haliotis rufescens]|uniref:non-symbiotic hemoglobin 1-like n=1 Tax=Haliotis rufescens TaxID=6454 RepID=UPI001EAFB187|nr:non-symbiotic hemoglobin 1-like [Haliotis rufescens]
MMGCFNSKKLKSMTIRSDSKRSRGSGKKYLPQDTGEGQAVPSPRGLPEERPEFTERQKEIVLDTWQIIQKDIARVGVVMFMRLFETHPDVQEVFMPFKGKSKEDLSHSAQLKAHALRVMGTVEKCLARINEPKKMEELLHDLGAKHVMYNARVDYIDLIGPQFLWAIQPAMKDSWTPEIEQAWSDLFKLISHIIKEAMLL